MNRMRSRTRVSRKPFKGDFDAQINTQASDYPAGFAVCIKLGSTRYGKASASN
jgi:hypothetical protein